MQSVFFPKKLLPVIGLLAALLIFAGHAESAYTKETSSIRWMDYSQDAFSTARKSGKPIFMLITAVWCHWCHVYEKQALETQEVSEYLNDNYINILVDYDKRNDIVSSKYPPSGLPYTVIISNEGETLVAIPGHIPKKELLANLKKTVASLKSGYTPDSDISEKANDDVAEKPVLEIEDLDATLEFMKTIIKSNYDKNYGGFGDNEKQANAETLLFMLALYRRAPEAEWLEMVDNTLNHMGGLKTGETAKSKRPDAEYLLSLYKQKKSKDWFDKVFSLQRDDKIYGLYDHAGAGFFRYALARNWGMPHFEKILKDNAEIIRTFAIAYEHNKNPEFKNLAEGGLGYVLNVLYDARGYFYGSQVADEVYYHMDKIGRKKVKAPEVDKTGYTVANSQMLLTLLEAWRVFDDERYKITAQKVFTFFLKNMISDRGALSYFDYKNSVGELDGQLKSNAWLALAFLEGSVTLKDSALLAKAETLIDFMVSELYDNANGGFFERSSSSKKFYRHDEFVSYKKPYLANGVAGYVLVRAYELTGNVDYLKKAEETLGAFIEHYPDASLPYFQRVALKLKTIKLNNKEKENGRKRNS